MSKAILVDDDGDLALDAAGRIRSVSGADKIAQDLKLLLRSVKGSLPFDTNFGIDDLSQIKSPNSRLISSAVKNALLQHESVNSVQDISLEKNDRSFEISLTAILTDGTSIDLGVSL
ncbi:MAG: GPW/gp25 family protein [Methanomicrobiaceae archaeon]|nr:GPW/gp25 family protein [Methanomicrobiaceae archaeon]